MTVIWPDSGDGDEDEDKDKDEDKDEIPNYKVLLTTSVERFGVSRMRDFKVAYQKKERILHWMGMVASSRSVFI